VIANLIFDLSGYGGSANFTAATTTDLINELNTLTGVTWYWDPADCKPKSNFYPGVPPVITTQYKVSFVDIDNDSIGFCNAGSLDFTKFNEIDLTAYGGSATTAVANNTDIVNAFAALSLTVSVSGCDLIIDNWNHVSTPTNVEVNLAVAGCVVNSIVVPIFNGGYGPIITNTPFVGSITGGPMNMGAGGLTIDWGDGTVITQPTGPYGGTHTYAAAGNYSISISYIDINGNPVIFTGNLNVDAAGVVTRFDVAGNKVVSGIKTFSPTFNTTDCNNVLMSVAAWQSVAIGPPAATTNEISATISINATTVTSFIDCTAACAFSVTNHNIGAITVPMTLPMVIQFKDEVTGNNVNTVTTTVYIS
jgi:hypothetical protein